MLFPTHYLKGALNIQARLDCRLKDSPADLPDWRKRNRKQMALAASAIIATSKRGSVIRRNIAFTYPSQTATTTLCFLSTSLYLRVNWPAQTSVKSNFAPIWMPSSPGVTPKGYSPERVARITAPVDNLTAFRSHSH